MLSQNHLNYHSLEDCDVIYERPLFNKQILKTTIFFPVRDVFRSFSILHLLFQFDFIIR